MEEKSPVNAAFTIREGFTGLERPVKEGSLQEVSRESAVRGVGPSWVGVVNSSLNCIAGWTTRGTGGTTGVDHDVCEEMFDSSCIMGNIVLVSCACEVHCFLGCI